MMRRWFQACPRQVVGLCVIAAGGLVLTGCADSRKSASGGSRVDPKYGVSASPRVVEPGQPVPKGGGVYRVGRPYAVAGRMYYPKENKRYRADGVASWYGSDFHGRLTANGEVYDMESLSAAHPTMPMPSYARVTNLRNGRSLIVRVNDRGPFHAERVIDLSSKAAELLEVRRPGTARVRVEYIGPAALEGSDDRRLLATLRDNGRAAPPPSAVRLASLRPTMVDITPPPSARREPPVRTALLTTEETRRPTMAARLGREEGEVVLPRAPANASESGKRSKRAAPQEPQAVQVELPPPPIAVTGRGLY